MYIDIEAAGCPNTCRHCSPAGHLPYGSLFSLEELRLIRQEWVPLTLRYEPTAHPDFPAIYAADIASDNGGWLVSNGFGIARRQDYQKMMAQMRKMGMHTVAFTLHGLRDHHDWFVCRKGAFDDILLATRRVRQAGFTPKWQIFVDRRGIAGIPELIKLAIKECGEPPDISLPYHRVGGRLWHYEAIRPTLQDVLDHRLHELVDDPGKNCLISPETLTASAWLEKWASSANPDGFRHIFEPPSWPPSPEFEHLSLRIQRDRKVFIDPFASNFIYLGELSEGRETLLSRLNALPAPQYQSIQPGDVLLNPVEKTRLHPVGASLRYLAISKASKDQIV